MGALSIAAVSVALDPMACGLYWRTLCHQAGAGVARSGSEPSSRCAPALAVACRTLRVPVLLEVEARLT